MPRDPVTGIYTPARRWVEDAQNGVPFAPEKFDEQDQDFAQALNQVIDDARAAIDARAQELVTNAQTAVVTADAVSTALGYTPAPDEHNHPEYADKTTAVTGRAGEIEGGGDLSANRELGLADSGVTPGTYTNATVTVDAKGRVTAAQNGTSTSAGNAAWGAISGLISDQTDLVVELGKKADLEHDHAGVYAPVNHSHDGVYSLATHTHTAVEITDLQPLLDAKSDNTHDHAGVYIEGVRLGAAVSYTGDPPPLGHFVEVLSVYDPAEGTWSTGQARPLQIKINGLWENVA